MKVEGGPIEKVVTLNSLISISPSLSLFLFFSLSFLLNCLFQNSCGGVNRGKEDKTHSSTFLSLGTRFISLSWARESCFPSYDGERASV